MWGDTPHGPRAWASSPRPPALYPAVASSEHDGLLRLALWSIARKEGIGRRAVGFGCRCAGWWCKAAVGGAESAPGLLRLALRPMARKEGGGEGPVCLRCARGCVTAGRVWGDLTAGGGGQRTEVASPFTALNGSQRGGVERWAWAVGSGALNLVA